MQYDSCESAIRTYRSSARQSNVSQERDECACSQEASACDWIGNGIHFACLLKPRQHAERVYTGHTGGGHAFIQPSQDPTASHEK